MSKILFYLYLLSIFLASVYPVKELPADDKLTHFLAYFILAVLMRFSLNTGYWSTFFYGSFYGFFIETVQYFLPYRSGEYGDFVADTFGVLCGLFSYFLFEFVYLELKNKE
ncbi:MAG TPA: VanZ family protein [Persephonella sp.]|nr:VanZ family protein [Persephonella sp.]